MSTGVSYSCKDSNLVALGPLPYELINLITSLRTLSPKQTHSEVLEIRASTYECGVGGKYTIYP